MKYVSALLIIFSAIILFSCGSETKALEERNLTFEEKVEASLSLDYLTKIGAKEKDIEYLKKIYADKNFKSFWINDSMLTNNGLEVLSVINTPYKTLTPLNRYDFLNITDSSGLFEKESYITLKLAYLNNDLKNGFIDTVTKSLNSVSLPKEDISAYFSKNENESWLSKILSASKEHEKYNLIAKNAVEFFSNYPMDTTTFKIKSMKKDSASSYNMAKPALVAHGFMDSVNISDSLFLNALKSFQLMNGLKDDAVIGTYTAKALNESNYQRYERTLLAMEKWRWKDSLPNKYIWVNIPAYKLHYYINDSLKRVHRVVVGAKATKTPEFHAKMKTIVTFPFWHVPYSISSTEILAGAKRDTNYFNKRGYTITQGGASIDPKSVDWSTISESSFNYRVRQNGGGSNSLGLVKMLFPNPHSVYIHDTPAKYRFAGDIRAYSHGCIRCQDPRDLAKYILKRDKHPYADSVDMLINNRRMQHLALKDPFEVYIDYISVDAWEDKGIQFFPDVYSRDEKWLNILFDRNLEVVEETSTSH